MKSDLFSSRLLSLVKMLKLNGQKGSLNYALISSFAKGAELVSNYFDDILKEIFADTAQDYGRQMICDLVNLGSFDYDSAQKYLSGNFSRYKYKEFENEFLKLPNVTQAGYISLFEFIVGTFDKSNFSNIFNIAPFSDKYICPGVIVKAVNTDFDFDALDSFDYNADDWDKISANTFNFIDSLGGEV